MAKVVREKEFAVPFDLLFETITKVEDYPEFLTEVVSAKRKPGGTPAKFEATFEIEVVKRFQYTLEFQVLSPEEITWRLCDSNFFKTNSGSWKLKATGPEKTSVDYWLNVEFGFLVPGWISKKLIEINLPKMFEAFESQAKKKMKIT